MRCRWLDNLKGFAMLLVVLGHVFAWQYGKYGQSFFIPEADENPSLLLWWHIIYSFHMPLLFWISGFLFGNSINKLNTVKSFLMFFIKKTRGLLVPYFFAGICFSLLTGEKWTQYWFLASLFVVFGVSIFVEYVCKLLPRFKYLDLCLYIVSYLLWIRIQPFFLAKTGWSDILGYHRNWLFWAFVFGVLSKKYGGLTKLVINNNIVYSFSLIFFVLYHYALNSQLHSVSIVYSLWMSVLVAFAGIIIAVQMFSRIFITNNVLLKFLNYLGIHSLDIYIFHFYFVIMLPIGTYMLSMGKTDAFHTVSMCTIQLLAGLLVSSLVCSCALFLSKIIRHSSLISFLFLGKK